MSATTEPAPTDITPTLLTPHQTCKFLSIGKTTLWRLRCKGAITPVSLQGEPRYRRSDLERYVAKLKPHHARRPRRDAEEPTTVPMPMCGE